VYFDGRTVQAHVFDVNGQDLFLLQPGKNPIQDAGFAPAIHPRIDRMPIAKILRQAAPFAAILNYVQQRVKQLQIGDADVAALAWQAICNALKLSLG
jgi:hypothetical protein